MSNKPTFPIVRLKSAPPEADGCSDEAASPPKKVSPTIPMFELVGPPCEVAGCSGKLVITANLHTADNCQKCATCGAEFYQMTGQETLDALNRVIDQTLKGEEND